MLNFLMRVKLWASALMSIGGIALIIAFIVGRVFFDIIPPAVATWLGLTALLILVIAFFLALFAFVMWFFFSPPYTLLPFLALLGFLLFLVAVFVYLTPMFPLIDLGSLFTAAA